MIPHVEQQLFQKLHVVSTVFNQLGTRRYELKKEINLFLNRKETLTMKSNPAVPSRSIFAGFHHYRVFFRKLNLVSNNQALIQKSRCGNWQPRNHGNIQSKLSNESEGYLLLFQSNLTTTKLFQRNLNFAAAMNLCVRVK